MKRCSTCKEHKPFASFDPDKRASTGRAAACKECHRKRQDSWRSRNPDGVKLLERQYRARHRDRLAERRRKYYLAHREVAIATASRNVQKNKDAAYENYGGYLCKCCGESERAFLCLDHVNNDGYRHRKEIGTTAGIYQWLRLNGYPAGMFQVLCYNCNQGKRINKGTCPHQRIVEI